jgi:hypothetical protein
MENRVSTVALTLDSEQRRAQCRSLITIEVFMFPAEKPRRSVITIGSSALTMVANPDFRS